MEHVGEALRTARRAANVSLERMAVLTHYSTAMLSLLENGRRPVRPKHIAAYEEALGVSIDPERSRVAPEDVDLLLRATDFVTAVGLRHGGIAAAEMARTQWEWTHGLLRQSMSDSIRSEFSAQAGRLADRYAWSLADSGRPKQSTSIYKNALNLAYGDPTVRAVVTVDLANHLTGLGTPAESLDLLGGLGKTHPVLDFTANSARALAHATLGDWNQTIRHIDLADAAHASVDLSALPATHAPYASGHDAHAHSAAGKSLYLLASRGCAKAVPRAVDRLTQAAELFGPERARAVARCNDRLARLRA